jgi:hypothetical protein
LIGAGEEAFRDADRAWKIEGNHKKVGSGIEGFVRQSGRQKDH